jgi:hypothetical protein
MLTSNICNHYMTKKAERKQYLMDVVLIRLSLIGLLIIYHAFAIYTGSWKVPYEGFIEIDVYNWFGMLTHSFQLEIMVFISGLLLGYSTKPFTFQLLVVKKAKRILLPCLIFGVIYYVMFYDLKVSWYAIIYRIVNGCGHLWFLPMIFWCFVVSYVLSKYINVNRYCKQILIISLFLIPANPLFMLPFGLGSLCSFYFYFFLGFCIERDMIKMPAITLKKSVWALLVFCAFFIVYMFLREIDPTNMNKIVKILMMVARRSCHTITVLSAIFVVYGLSNTPKVISYLTNKAILIKLSGYCYGVYIYQQFILRVLYYDTSLPYVVSEYALPWIAFVITLFVSLILCHFTLKTKFGRFLIG